MKRMETAANRLQWLLRIFWYGGLLAVWLWALWRALSMELNESQYIVGLVLVLWPLALALSVSMARNDLLADLPVLCARAVPEWGTLVLPEDWQANGTDVLALTDPAGTLRAVVLKGQCAAATLPDGTAFTAALPGKRRQMPESVLRCRYTAGTRRGRGLCTAAAWDGAEATAIFLSRRPADAFAAGHLFDGDRN